MLLWIPVFLLFPRDPLNMVHAYVTNLVDVDANCHGYGKQILILDEQPLSIDSGDIFKQLRERDNFDCRWNIKARNVTNGIVAIVESLWMRKNSSGSCVDYLQFGMKRAGKWISGETFCDTKISSMADILADSNGTIVDPEGDLRIFLHVGNASSSHKENLELVISFNTYSEGRKIAEEEEEDGEYRDELDDEESIYRPISAEEKKIPWVLLTTLSVTMIVVASYVIYKWYRMPSAAGTGYTRL